LLATGQFPTTSQPVKVWDLETLQATSVPDAEIGPNAFAVSFSPDGKYLAACADGLTIWRLAKGEHDAGNAPRLSFQRVVHFPGHRSLYLRINSTSKLLAWVDLDHSVCLWDLEKGREIPFLGPPLVYGWHNLAFFPDGDHLTFGAATGRIETWDTRTVGRVSSFGKADNVAHLASSPDGQWLATEANPSTVAVWNSKAEAQVFSLPQESGPIWSQAWSPDGERLAVGLADGAVEIWNVSKIQAELGKIGLAWSADARPLEAPEPQPFVPTTAQERRHQLIQRTNLANRLRSQGRLANSLPQLAALWSSDQENSDLSLQVAALQAWFGQDKEYAATRARILAFAHGTRQWKVAEGAAKACSILPAADKADLDAALALGRAAVHLERSGWTLLALGMAEYRSGNDAAAQEALLAASEADQNNFGDFRVTTTSAFYRAMSLFRQGKKVDASKLALAAAATMTLLTPLPKDEQNPLANNRDHDHLILWLAYKEAKHLIQFETPPASATRQPDF
jgi:hypothetical protein